MIMNLCTSQACRLTVLLFVIFLAGYLIWTNSQTKVKEYFDDDATADIPTQVSQIYKEVYNVDIPKDDLDKYTKSFNATNFDPNTFKEQLTAERTASVQDMINKEFQAKLKRQATPDEMEKYTTAFMTNKMTTTEQLDDDLAISPEVVSNADTKNAKQNADLTKDDYALYKKIIDIYQKELDRLPNSAELSHYFNMLKTDSSFTLDKLEEALLASREHDILEKNQVNTVQGDLMGNINDRQIQMIVVAIYKSIYFVEPDQATYNFLKAKFISFDLSEDKLINFIKQLKSADQSPTLPTNNQSDVIQSGSVSNPSSQTDAYNKFINQNPSTDPFVMEKPQDATTSTPTTDASKSDDTSGQVLVSGTSSNAETFADESVGGISTQKILDNIKKGGSCQFDRNKIDNKASEYSALIDQRNTQDCSKSTYINADDNLVLLPGLQWQVPQRRQPVCYGNNSQYNPLTDQTSLIGTLLTDASGTQVGSIMPKFTYKEDVTY